MFFFGLAVGFAAGGAAVYFGQKLFADLKADYSAAKSAVENREKSAIENLSTQ